MNSVRDAILLGTRGATETHTTFQVREQLEQSCAAVDVFGTIEELGVSLLFRPLEGLLGACLRLSDAGAGILVTTGRDLHMQRFTDAHELGHFVLEHEGSFDREIGFPGQITDRDHREVAADAFAAEFLMPRWLFFSMAKAHGWAKKQLINPITVYQLSLRLAVSYEATCWGLLSHKILDVATVENLRRVAPKKIKQQLLGSVRLEDPWADVWLFDEHDEGASFQAGPHDLFIANLAEHSGSGYLWDTESLGETEFTIIEDQSRRQKVGELRG